MQENPVGRSNQGGDNCAPVAAGRQFLRACCLWATAAAALLAVVPAAVGGAQPEIERTPARDDGMPPAPAMAMNAYRVLRAWLNDWAVPTAPPTPGQADTLPSCPGACVVLRLEHRTIGRGGDIVVALAGDRDHTTERAVWRAFLGAFAEADRRLPVPSDARRLEAARAIAEQVTMSLEMAGPSTPIQPATFADLDTLVAPGLEGVAVRHRNRVEAAYPSAMIMSNLTPAEAARGLVARVTGSAEIALVEAAELRDRHELTFLKFRVTHLVQPGPREEPRFLYRGSALADRSQLDASRLRLMAAELARHLRLRLPEDDAPLGLRGAYQPWSGEFAGSSAEPHEQALAALALRRYAGRAWTPVADAQAAAASADEILHELDDVDLDEQRPWDSPGAAALCVLALRESPGAFGAAADESGGVRKSHVDLLARATERVLASYLPGKGFAPEVPMPARAAIAAALLRLDGSRALADEAIRTCFKETPPPALPGLMPMLAWAEIDAAEGRATPAAPSLRQLRDEVWRHQASEESVSPNEADWVGGISFSRESPPDWQGLRALAMNARMLRVADLTAPAEAPGEVRRLLRGVRFLHQLQVDTLSSWACAAPGQALGGVRAAPWNQLMPVDATSTGLLFVCELLDSLEHLTKGSGSR
ncbi:MAG: hypothetical protein AB7K52_05545 [Phycisphaerales bacterium]